MKNLTIPYISDFKGWNEMESLIDFAYSGSLETPPKTEFRAYFDKESIYFQFIAFGSKPLVYIRDNNKLEVINSERVELFFRSNLKMQPYYCLEIDPTGRVLDYMANYYREFNYNWNWPEPIDIQTEVEENIYSVQAKISLSSLKDLGLINSGRIEAGVFRGHCTSLNGNNSILKWISWVDPETPKPDFHVPSAFGYFLLNNY